MQLPRLAACIDTVPIENTISSVAVLLNFHEQVPSAYRVQPARRQEHRVACFHANFLNAGFDCSFIERTLELLSCYQFAKSKKKFCAGIGGGYVPEFCFGFATKSRCDLFRRMNLQGKLFPRIKQFDEKRESGERTRLACCFRRHAENLLSVLTPNLVQTFAFQKTVTHNALRFGTVDDFPRFADLLSGRQLFAEELAKFLAAPDSLHENGLED